MGLLQHYFKILGIILLNHYRYKKVDLLIDYTRLTLNSIAFHKFARKKEDTNHHLGKVAGYVFEFISYPQAISLFEEIFIAQQYKFDINSMGHSCIIDCGSNIGLSVLYFRITHPNSPIIAFEPDEQSFAILKRNIERNNIKQVTLHQAALSDKETSVPLYANANGSFLNMSLSPTAATAGIHAIVQSKKLSDFVRTGRTILKIDTEGSEYAIIEDLIQSNAMQYIDQMIIECHENTRSGTSKGLIKALEDNHFLCDERRHPLFKGAKETMIYVKRP